MTYLTLRSSKMTAQVSPYGARLEHVAFHDGANLVLHADPNQHPGWHDFYPGAIVGPVANRVRGGKVHLKGVTYQMPTNENDRTALHSGPNGLDRKIWNVTAQEESTTTLRCTLADGDGGLPGLREITARYALSAATLTLSITATTDRDTPINIAHHPYWRLGDARAHLLQVHAAHYLPVDPHNLPTGAVADVTGTTFDHRTPKPLAHDIDHNLCTARHKHTTPRHVATLSGAQGVRLHIDSTEPGLQVYGGAYLPEITGTDIAPHAGIALEPQGWPDAVHHPDFPSIICTPTQPYTQITCYRFDQEG
ncbi:aldose epimerase family protein [uncultured Tateyamaria sp.]|uniref:aldose epimerase family protein n=1 Tax=uncultured Tateyamaria sp. TaxID=455651 RepID=UPI002628F043|nr:aldose epimerase family protein [uncultured Tateyamaria sp.]